MIEIQVEKIIEVLVENKIYVDKEYERLVEKPFDVVRENIIFNEKMIEIDESDIKKYKDAKVLETIVDYVYRDRVTE